MNRVALVTGGQRGIGLGVVKALASAGYRVAVVSLPSEEDPEVQAVMTSPALAGNCAYFQMDMVEADTKSSLLLDRIEARLGPVITLVNNAGIGSPVRGDMLDVTPASLDLVMDVNLKGAFFLAQETARRMVARDDGALYRSISFVTSVSASMVSIERAEYCLSKSASSMMAQLFSVRLARHGIGVFELQPGIIATPLTAGVKDKYDTRIAQGLVPANRWGEPSDVGGVIVPLARGDFAFSTGMRVPIDGALSVHRL